MTKKRRRFIFWIFVALFIIASIAIILYAQGWRFDLNSLKLTRTGGIFIKTSTSEAKIYINDRYIGSTSGILNYTKLIDDLIPKNYNIFIYKEGYYPWNKAVEVKNGLVTELFYVILFPLEIKKDKIAELPMQNVYNFSIDNQNIKIINAKKSRIAKTYDINGKFISNENFSTKGVPAIGWKTATSTELISPDKKRKLRIKNDEIFIDYLADTEKEPYKKAGEKEKVATSELPILFLDWLNDSEHIIWIANNELTITERDNRGGKRNSVKFYLNINPPFFWDRDNSNLYFFETSKGKLVLYKLSF